MSRNVLKRNRVKQLCHEWANRKFASGIVVGGNIYYDKDVIYSYGEHWALARLVGKDANGKPTAVLLNNARCSQQTHEHLCAVIDATSHLLRLPVYDVLTTHHGDNLDDFKDRIKNLAARVIRARTYKAMLLRQLDELLSQANSYAALFKLKTRFSLPSDFDREKQLNLAFEETRKDNERKAKKHEAERLKRKAEIEQQVLKYEQEKLEYPAKVQAWLDGESDNFPAEPVDPDGPAVRCWDAPRKPDRLRVKGSRIQTSRAAVVNVDTVKEFLNVLRNSTVTVPTDLSIDGFVVNAIDREQCLVHVGCHVIEFEEIERIAKQLNL